LDVFALAGSLVWAAGFVIDAMADAQKSRFRAVAETKGRFIDAGWWS
jgi:steroid 5-alpha reductase family enzyme